jgi:hypothetical protein
MRRSRSFYERVAFAAIVLAALAKLGQENQARSFARLAAWNKRQVQRLERTAKGAITPSVASPPALALLPLGILVAKDGSA